MSSVALRVKGSIVYQQDHPTIFLSSLYSIIILCYPIKEGEADTHGVAMLLLTLNAAVVALFFGVVVIPPLFIYDPSRHPGESVSPPHAGEIISENSVSHSVKQKLYMLFTIPICSMLNWLFLYFAYYRHIRFVEYRIELNIISLYESKNRSKQQLNHYGVEDIPGMDSLTFERNTNNLGSFSFPRTEPDREGHDSEEPKQSLDQRIAHPIAIRGALPKNIKREVYVTESFYPEIRELFRVVENALFTPAIIVEKNFLTEVSRLLGEPLDCAGSGHPTLAPPHWSNQQEDGFYASRRVPSSHPPRVEQRSCR